MITESTITTFHREADALVRAYVDDVEEIVSLLADTQGCAMVSPGSDYLIAHGAIAETGIGCAIDQEAVGAFVEFCASNAGKAFRVTYEVVEEPNDTERPPPMFSPEEPDTFAPVTNVSSDSDEVLTSTRGGRMVPRYPGPEELRWDAKADGGKVAS
jgi:hypothetical protein